MPWQYSQSSGQLTAPDGSPFAIGFAGRDAGMNNPAMQFVSNIGPLPQGEYEMGPWFDKHPQLGLCVIELTPSATNVMEGRSGFFIHGANPADVPESSHGCIVIGNCATRKQIWDSIDHALLVVA